MNMQIGKSIDIEKGTIVNGEDTVMSSVLFYYVDENTHLHLKDTAYEYLYAFYTMRWQEDYIYSYAYQQEQNWADYSRGLSEAEGYTQKDASFTQKGYIRISIRRKDGKGLKGEDVESVYQIVEVEHTGVYEQNFTALQDVNREIIQTVDTIRHYQNENTLTFTLLTDSHMTVNGTWQDTAATVKAVDDEIRPEGIIHLGDLEDGTLEKEYCRYYKDVVLNDLRTIQPKVYLTVGNHDTNYFRNNPDILSEEEIYDYYIKDISAAGKTEKQLWYYEDYKKQKLRMYFLHSYDHKEPLRYGYSVQEISWLMENLDTLPDDYHVIIFSYEAPIARLDYWVSEVRNGEMLLTGLEKWHNAHGRRIMAFVHGHTHADYIYQERVFPIISVGCSKCEYFIDKKPEGAATYRRIRHTVTQELWDTLIIDTKEKTLRFIRFGAGVDRELEDGKLTRMQNNLTEGKQRTQVWAHRGASGYAPENTLEAFQMAIELGADGVELDVQFTKDRQLVVIHDETIDRVSDGHGKVVDYTLEELRQYNFNRTHPEYERCTIPTLEEVLTLMKPTGMTVNIELKTGINFYDGIEDSVLRMVDRLEMQEQIIYSSFNHYSILKIKEFCPKAHTGFLYADGTLHMAEYASQYMAEALHPSFWNMQYVDLMPDCRQKGIRLHVWTVNNRQDMEQMVQAGVDAIITNYPDVAYEVAYGEKAPESELKLRVEKCIQEEREKEAACIRAREEAQTTEAQAVKSTGGNPNKLLHAMGVGYSKLRKLFVEIDTMVQKAAGKTG